MNPFKCERRRYQRSKFRGPVELSWTDTNGIKSSAGGHCVNVSVFGISVEFPQPLPVGTEVTVQAEAAPFPESGRVCHCRRYGAWFRVGLRFAKPVARDEITEVAGNAAVRA